MCARMVRTLLLAGVALAAAAASAQAGTVTATSPVQASGAVSPFASCSGGAAEGGTNFANSEVEPWVDVNPTDADDDEILGDNIVGYYQQDRWSNGGSKGLVAAVSFDDGASWIQTVPNQLTVCTDGSDAPFDRASDPWISFSPNGNLHAMSLVLDPDPSTGGFGDNGMVYNRSTDGGLTWDDPIVLRADFDPNYLNDKNSITADPNDSDFVYAVWDRVQDASRAQHAQDNPIGLGFKGPIWFARTTDGGETFEPAHKIYESGANKQTIGNQIVVEPDAEGGSLFDFFGDIVNSSERRRTFGPIGIAYIRSDNHGATWTKPFQVADQLPMSLFRASSTIDPETDPACPDPDGDGNCPIRGGDFIPEVAVNASNGDLYAVWMDSRFGTGGAPFGEGLFEHDSIAFTQSTDGGQTWSTPIKVNATPEEVAEEEVPVDNQQAFTPSVDVADDGTVTVTYYDFRNNTPDTSTLPTNYWANHCHPGSEDCSDPDSWDEETPIAGPFDITLAPFARGWFLGDYMGLTPDGNDLGSLFGSTDGSGPSSIFFSRLEP
jgi:hypothetical protein